MNKKGQLEISWLWIVYLVLVGIIIAVFINYLGGSNENAVMQKFYLDDITFLVNKILSSKFDVEYEYEVPNNFLIEITEDEVKVGLNEYILSKEYIRSKHKIIYEKKEDKLILRRE